MDWLGNCLICLSNSGHQIQWRNLHVYPRFLKTTTIQIRFSYRQPYTWEHSQYHSDVEMFITYNNILGIILQWHLNVPLIKKQKLFQVESGHEHLSDDHLKSRPTKTYLTENSLICFSHLYQWLIDLWTKKKLSFQIVMITPSFLTIISIYCLSISFSVPIPPALFLFVLYLVFLLYLLSLSFPFYCFFFSPFISFSLPSPSLLSLSFCLNDLFLLFPFSLSSLLFFLFRRLVTFELFCVIYITFKFIYF